MKRPRFLLKMATVISSVLLVGGFVAYRAGALNTPLETSARPADAESSPGQEKFLYDGTSKSLMIFESAPSQQPPTGAAQRSPTLMSSSKSAVIGEALTKPPPSQPPAAKAP